MSVRNSRKEKQLRRLRKAIKSGRLPAYIDLYEYLTDRRIAKSRKEAREMMLAGRVKVESHTVGRIKVADVTAPGGERWFPYPLVPAEARGRILVSGK